MFAYIIEEIFKNGILLTHKSCSMNNVIIFKIVFLF